MAVVSSFQAQVIACARLQYTMGATVNGLWGWLHVCRVTGVIENNMFCHSHWKMQERNMMKIQTTAISKPYTMSFRESSISVRFLTCQRWQMTISG